MRDETTKPRPLNIVLAAEESAGARTLRAIHAAGHNIVAVMTSAHESVGGPLVSDLAHRLGRPVWRPELVRNPTFAHVLCRERVDLLLNVHSLHVIATEVAEAPSIGSFNLHPGPLPAYAGLDAPSWAVYHGERRYGSTLHWLTTEVDGGPIAYSTAFDVDPAETAISLYHKCVRHGIPLVSELVTAAATGGRAAIPATPQNSAERRYFRRAVPHDGWLLWSLEAHRLAALVRACDFGPFDSPWGSARTVAEGLELEVLRATATDEAATSEPGTIGAGSENGVLVAAADNWLLVEAVRVGDGRVDPRSVLREGTRCTPIRE